VGRGRCNSRSSGASPPTPLPLAPAAIGTPPGSIVRQWVARNRRTRCRRRVGCSPPWPCVRGLFVEAPRRGLPYHPCPVTLEAVNRPTRVPFSPHTFSSSILGNFFSCGPPPLSPLLRPQALDAARLLCAFNAVRGRAPPKKKVFLKGNCEISAFCFPV
jgi:hypothetical protein